MATSAGTSMPRLLIVGRVATEMVLHFRPGVFWDEKEGASVVQLQVQRGGCKVRLIKRVVTGGDGL